MSQCGVPVKVVTLGRARDAARGAERDRCRARGVRKTSRRAPGRERERKRVVVVVVKGKEAKEKENPMQRMKRAEEMD